MCASPLSVLLRHPTTSDEFNAMGSQASLWACVASLLAATAAAAATTEGGTSLDILVVSPFPSKSHVILGDGYVNILLEAGHKVTYVTADPQNNTNPLLRQIDVSSNTELFPPNIVDIKAVIKKEMNTADPKHFVHVMMSIARATLENEEVVGLALDPARRFDLVIAEWMFNELYAGLPAVFECPLIWFSTMEPHWMILQLVDEVTNPSHTSALLSRNTPPFSFAQRIEELFLQSALYFLKEWDLYYTEAEIYRNYYGPILAKRGRRLPPYNEVRFNASLVLGNSYAALGQAGGLPASYKPVAGYHIRPDVKLLPRELQKIMDAASDGVVYFSLGTIVRGEDLPHDVKRKIVEVLGRLKQTVVWKFGEQLAELPPNVHVVPWAPQQSILAHPNCVLFITHGGLLSLTEAVHFAVPVVGIPVFGDQPINIQRAVHKGFALSVDLSLNIAEDLEEALREMLSNPSYRSRVKELSYMYHHRPASPRAEVAHWAAHVVATRGAPHLRSPALLVPWYQKIYMDLAAVLAVVLTLCAFIVKCVLSLIVTKIKSYRKKNN